MSALDPLPRQVSSLWLDSGRLPVRLEQFDFWLGDTTNSYLIRDNRDEWLSNDGLHPQIIELPLWALALLGGTADEDYPHRVFVAEAFGQLDPHRYFTIPEEVINLVSDGVDPASLIGQPLETYQAILSLIAEVGTLGSRVVIMNDDQIKDLTFKARK